MKNTDLGDTLLKALQAAGINYTVKPELSTEEEDNYRNMSPKQMASAFIMKYDLIHKNKLLIILMEIYDLNKKGIFAYSMDRKLKDYDLPNKIYLYMFRHFKNFLVKIEGVNRATTYTWLPQRKPDIVDTEVFYSLYQDIRGYKLNPNWKNFIEDHLDMPVNKIIEAFQITNEREKVIVGYIVNDKIQHIKTYSKTKEKKKAEESKIPDKIISRTKFNEIGDKIKQQEKIIKDKEFFDTKFHEKEMDESKGTDILKEKLPLEEEIISSDDVEVTESYLFLMNERLEFYEKIIRNQSKHIKKLEKALMRKLNSPDKKS